ncbi:MAG: 3-deoxy-7-phosphoheptulonate synthase [Chloroflexia bacterium]|nr:3-deoxy-7-phosphoheptulonate synthase [Chloroflexia bacterium]
MLITITPEAPSSTRSAILLAAAERGLRAQVMANGKGGEVVAIAGALPPLMGELPGVESIQPVHKPYMLASLESRSPSVVDVGGVKIGGGAPVIMAGPCSIESRDTLVALAHAVKAAGATMLRGGAFKPRSSPYSFQGLGVEGLQHLAAAREATGLPVVTEVMEPDQVGIVADYADMLQIGSRNMANFPLLKRIGQCSTPVLLKRGFSATLEELLMSAEYIMASGNPNVVLCERGIRGFDAAFRFNLDLNIVPAIREVSHLPVIVDPSHGTGRRSLVKRMAMAGIASGADGLMVEVHPDPDQALSDGYQTITPDDLAYIGRYSLALHEALTGLDDDRAVDMPALDDHAPFAALREKAVVALSA